MSQAEYLCIPNSFLAFLIGFIDGDGYIGIRNNRNNIQIYLSISLHLDDISVLNYIQSVLKLGKMYSYPDRKSPTVKLIFSKLELQEVLFPLILHHGFFFLTNTLRAQFNLAMYIIKNDLTKYSDIPPVAPVIQELPTSPLEYANLSFFKDWIVGFVCSEGSFLIKKNNDGCFQIKQRLHILLFEAFKLVFNTDRKITVDKELYAQFGVSSKSDIQSVINFFSFSGYHSLVGRRLIEYLSWVEAFNSRYFSPRIHYTGSNPKVNKNILHSGIYCDPKLMLIGIVAFICLCIFPEYFWSMSSDYICLSLNLIPVVVYDNADKEKAIAIKSNRKKSEIYRWTHRKSGKTYIGSSPWRRSRKAFF